MKQMHDKTIRVRFAPSPTGSLHLGGARTALYNFLLAKQSGGKFILRIEDTDTQRNTETALHTQIKDLTWLGLTWDEGPDPTTLADSGDYGPYRQSLRKHIYQKHAQQLLDQGLAYYCFLTDAEIEEQVQAAKAAGKPYQPKSPYRDLSISAAKQRLAQGEKASVRFKIPADKTHYTLTDLVRGRIDLPTDMISDFVILRSDGNPVYNFCCALDDALMKITHVLRGEEHLSNSLRQLMIYAAFNYTPPVFGHLSIILGENKKKLSKRDAAASCNDFKQDGYLAEAVCNYIALLGWSDAKGEEIFSLQELAKAFDVNRLNSSPATFDRTKLNWVNTQHLRKLSPASLWSTIKPWLDQAGLKLPSDPAWQQQSLQVFSTDLTTCKDAVEHYTPFSDTPLTFKTESEEVLAWPSSKTVFTKWIEILNKHTHDFLTTDDFEQALSIIKTQAEIKGKQLFMPIRIAVIGKPHGAELKQLIPLIPKSMLISRANQCFNWITTQTTNKT